MMVTKKVLHYLLLLLIGGMVTHGAVIVVIHDQMGPDDVASLSGGTKGEMLASPHAGMRRAELLTGKDALLSGVFGERGDRLRVADSFFKRFQKRGVTLGFMGCWGLGHAAPFDPQSHGFVILKDGVLGRNADDINTIKSTGTESLDEFLKRRENAKLVFWSGAWDSLKNLKEERKKIQQLCKEGHDVLWLGGGTRPLVWWSRSGEQIVLPTQLPQVASFLESALFPQMEKMENPQVLGFSTRHFGTWNQTRFQDKQQKLGLLTMDEKFVLANGSELYEKSEFGKIDAQNLMRKKAVEALDLIRIQQAWWEIAKQACSQPLRYQIPEQGELALSIADWAPSRLRPAAAQWESRFPITLPDLIELKKRIDYQDSLSFEDFTGVYALEVLKPGQYEFKIRFLPKGVASQDEKMKAGELIVDAESVRAKVSVPAGASEVKCRLDLDVGSHEVEVALAGQLKDPNSLLGAFFVTVYRVGEKMAEKVPLAPQL